MNYKKSQLEEEIVTNANISTLFSIQGPPTNKFKPDTISFSGFLRLFQSF